MCSAVVGGTVQSQRSTFGVWGSNVGTVWKGTDESTDDHALVAAHGVIIPVQTQYYALKGVAALLKIIKTVQTRLNPNLKVLGLLPTFYDSRTILARDMLDSLKDLGDHQVFDTVIRQSVKIGEAPTAGVPITVYEPRSDAAKSFVDLAKEVIGAHK